MPYDIAAKVLIGKCRHEILRRFVGIPVADSTVLEDVSQETTSLRRSDFPILSGCGQPSRHRTSRPAAISCWRC